MLVGVRTMERILKVYIDVICQYSVQINALLCGNVCVGGERGWAIITLQFNIYINYDLGHNFKTIGNNLVALSASYW